ncbi:hypothetical protein AVEN_152891-1 [Araneus ventricosus]|uniref:Uncharacterized protein n=1 Tax=Araneus ventricosus TaxID=182803 RepID=A0A4Y2ACT1_ARAVE|nr:hypothetical protein AVEN_152891-1 [Araneus ventricosus]
MHNASFSCILSPAGRLKKYKDVPELQTMRAYPSGNVPFKSKTVNDLMQLGNYTIGYANFYTNKNIFQWPTMEAECNVDREYKDEQHTPREDINSKPDSTEDPSCVGVVRKFGEWVSAQVSSTSSDRGSELRGPS